MAICSLARVLDFCDLFDRKWFGNWPTNGSTICSKRLGSVRTEIAINRPVVVAELAKPVLHPPKRGNFLTSSLSQLLLPLDDRVYDS